MKKYVPYIIVAITFFLLGIGFTYLFSKELPTTDSDRIIERLKRDSTYLSNDNKKLYEKIEELAKSNYKLTQGEIETYKKYDSIRNTIISDFDELIMRGAIIRRGKERFD